MILYEFVDQRGNGVITEWMKELSPVQRAQFDNKIDLLQRAPSLMAGLIAGPIKGYKHLYKLKIGGKVRLRPLLCRGPIDADCELTLLAGATERDYKFDPAGAPATAEENRKALMADTKRRRKL